VYETTGNSVGAFDNDAAYTRDAFGKMRVSNPQTLLDFRFPGQSSGSASFLSNQQQIGATYLSGFTASYANSKAIISAAAGATGYFLSQSRVWTTYQPGKSFLLLFSGMILPTSSTDSYKSRIGYFNSNLSVSPITTIDGLYFEYDCSDQSIAVVVANQGNQSATKQSLWNLDAMDGTGSSGITLDFSKCQLFVIDLEWLSVGRIRFGFYVYGQIVYCHEVTNINALSGPYTTSINLPVSYCLLTNGAASGSASITQICSTVISEGGYNPTGRPFSVNITTPYTFANENFFCALRGGGSNYYHQNITQHFIIIH